MKLSKVVYKGIECKIMFNYQNGNYEILCPGVEEIYLVNEKELELLDSNNNG
jgi:hypothetical protein